MLSESLNVKGESLKVKDERSLTGLRMSYFSVLILDSWFLTLTLRSA